jgi:hypothetical protein
MGDHWRTAEKTNNQVPGCKKGSRLDMVSVELPGLEI